MCAAGACGAVARSGAVAHATHAASAAVATDLTLRAYTGTARAQPLRARAHTVRKRAQETGA
jgi:hypothetical protein